MKKKEESTEQFIKDTAKRVFFAEGRLHATTQDIADAAGLSHTLLHYYFRSKDELIRQVFQEAKIEMGKRLDEVFMSKLTFRTKIEKMIELFLTEALAFPYQETFMITQMNSLGTGIYKEEKAEQIKIFLGEVQAEMDKGNIERMNPVHFCFNLFAMMSYPTIMRPLYKEFFKLSEADYKKLMQERKEIIMKMIFI